MHSNASDANRMSRRGFMNQATTIAAATAVAAKAGAAQGASTKSANARLGVGVIGCGGRGNAHLKALEWLQQQGEVQIVAACDVYRPRLERVTDKFEVKGYMDHRELIADPKVNVVTIATPDHVHGYQAIDAVRASKAVYCEKPVTHWRQFDLTKQLAQEVKKSGCAFQLGSQGMSDSAWHQMRALIKEGLIGRPLHAECGYFRVGDWGERGMPIDDPKAVPGPDLDWEAFLGDAPKRDFDVSRFFRWRMYEDYAGGPSTDLLPHSLTPVVYMLGVTFPTKVVATGGMFRYQEREIPDTYNTLIDYPEKVTICAMNTQGNDYSATGDRGAGGRIPVIRGGDGSLTVQGNKIKFIPAQGSDKKAQEFDIEHGEDLVGHFQNLMACCRAGTQDTSSPMDLAYYVQTALQMGMLGLRDNTMARFDADREAIVL
ncbi:MAG TPA: Gfo/Idh/MocA family oxidoreductase [Candidatus Hydrogenedentes bacterium]|nr:Gfo/Idh/MocA family oxidoreductase [Candidatus Hydrogenedentota bacterium]